MDRRKSTVTLDVDLLARITNESRTIDRYLDIEDSDEPYLDGIKYHAMPPLKRFRDMEHLSGGEKTMAALALLFAVHSYQPSPFFVLDEVDAALDNTNVARIANYIRDHAAPGMQFIVISLKTGLFQLSEALVGIYRDQSENSSKPLTLDVSPLSLTSFGFSLKFQLTNSPLAPQISVDIASNTRETRHGKDYRAIDLSVFYFLFLRFYD